MYVNTFFVFTLFLKTAAKVRPFLNIHNIFTHFFAQNCTKLTKVCKNRPLFAFTEREVHKYMHPSHARTHTYYIYPHPQLVQFPFSLRVSFVFPSCFARANSSDAAVIQQ